jgi:hypothetical protein
MRGWYDACMNRYARRALHRGIACFALAFALALPTPAARGCEVIIDLLPKIDLDSSTIHLDMKG